MNELLRSIKYKLVNFQKNFLQDLKPFLVHESDFNKRDHWFSSTEHVYLFESGGKLFFSVNHPGEHFVSFLDTEYNEAEMPSNKLAVLPDETFDLCVKGIVSGDLEAQLVITEYSNMNRIKTTYMNMNNQSTFTTTGETRKVRIALKLSGSGTLELETISFVLKEKKQSLVYMPSLTKPKDSITQIKDIKAACIFDEFSMTCFGKQLELITFSPDNWRDILTESRPDVLIVESSWRGNFGAWQYKIAKYNNQDKTPLYNLLSWCRQHHVPTIFWNKEDPIHFDKFIDTAKRFDYIYTTDQNMIPKYREAANHSNVFVMPFSAEPSLHNPIKIREERIPKISFAGSYYGNRHAERRKDMEEMLDIAAEFGLDIFDRNYEKNKNHKTDFSFPERFQHCIQGSLKYDEIQKAYKGYKVMLNVNSVKESPTMFSRRVFEGLASGTPILSSYSLGIRKFFPETVLISENKEKLKVNLQRLMEDETFYRSVSLEGIREVFLYHTYKHRLLDMLHRAGFQQLREKTEEIAVMAVVRSKQEFDTVVESFNRQTWKHKQLYLFLDLFDGYIDILNQYNTGNIKSFVLSYMNHYERLNEVVKTRYIAYLNPMHSYGENYLLDLAIAMEYSKADIIGKASYFELAVTDELLELNQGREYEYVENIDSDTAVMNQSIFQGESFLHVLDRLEKGIPLNRYFKKGARLFSSDKYNFVKSGQRKTKEIAEKVHL